MDKAIYIKQKKEKNKINYSHYFIFDIIDYFLIFVQDLVEAHKDKTFYLKNLFLFQKVFDLMLNSYIIIYFYALYYLLMYLYKYLYQIPIL